MEWTKFLILSILISFYGCNNYYINEKGAYRPNKPNFEFSKSPYQLKKDDLIDTNSVYVAEVKFDYKKPYVEEHFIRFFSNGRFFTGTPEVFETKLGLNEFNNYNKFGSIGYYRMQNNRLEIESYKVTLGGARGNTGFYSKYYGYIRNDSIFLFYDLSNKNSEMERITYPIPDEKNCKIYVRRKIEGLTGTPDW